MVCIMTQCNHLLVWGRQMEKATQLASKAGPQGMEDIDTDDEKDEEAEYELWKGREMARIRHASRSSLLESGCMRAEQASGKSIICIMCAMSVLS